MHANTLIFTLKDDIRAVRRKPRSPVDLHDVIGSNYALTLVNISLLHYFSVAEAFF